MKELSGDVPLSLYQKLYWLFSNAIRGAWGYTTYVPSEYIKLVVSRDGASSPGRKSTDAFLQRSLSSIDHLRSARILDIGGGSGYVRNVLSHLHYAGEYVCVDVEKDRRFDSFVSQAFSSTHVTRPIEFFESTQQFDIVLSITSLEHIPDDAVAVQKAKVLTKHGGIQIFIVPSYWSLPLYLFHGFRHYTPARIKRLFSDQSYTLYRLNGFFSFVCHFLCITIPERLLGTRGIRHRKWYSLVAYRAQALDRFFPFFSYMYAIVIT